MHLTIQSFLDIPSIYFLNISTTFPLYSFYSLLNKLNYPTDCGLKGKMIRTTLDPSTGELISDESDVPTVQLLYDYKPSASDMNPLLLY
jgi:hypothetical protein